MEILQLKHITEAALLAASEPLSLDQLAQLFDEGDRPTKDEFLEAIEMLNEESESRGVYLKQVSSGYRFQVKENLGRWVSRLWAEKPPRYSRALLETLSLIAYRQPITRGEIEEIRGVSVSSHIVKTLMEREWVRVVGHRDVPGRPAMYASTKTFLDYFNLKSLDELPSLAEIRDLDKINEELELLDPNVDVPGQNSDNENLNSGNSASENDSGPRKQTEIEDVSFKKDHIDDEPLDMSAVDEVLKSVEASFRKPEQEELEEKKNITENLSDADSLPAAMVEKGEMGDGSPVSEETVSAEADLSSETENKQ